MAEDNQPAKEEVKEAAPETSKDEAQENASSGSNKSMKLIIIAAVAAVLLSGVAVTTTILLIGSGSSEPQATAQEAKTPETEPVEEVAQEESDAGEGTSLGAPQFFPIRPAFVVNIPSKGRIRFLQIQVDIMSRDDDVIEEVEAYAPLIKNELVNLFSSQTYEGVISPGGKEKLRKEALVRVQKVMQEQAGVSGIEQILFTSFVTQ